MNERGVSLVELCMVIAIVAIVAGVSLPGWAALVAKQQHRAVVMEIASELRMARQLAMARHERIRVVVNAEQSELRTECVDCGMGSLRRYDLHIEARPLSRCRRTRRSCFNPAAVRRLRPQWS